MELKLGTSTIHQGMTVQGGASRGPALTKGLYFPANLELASIPDAFKDERIIEVMDWFIRKVRVNAYTLFFSVKPAPLKDEIRLGSRRRRVKARSLLL